MNTIVGASNVQRSPSNEEPELATEDDIPTDDEAAPQGAESRRDERPSENERE